MDDQTLSSHVAQVREFNRFYTRQIGLLNETLSRSRFSLTEARVIYELAQQDQTTAAELGRRLGLDAGYLSRMLRSFQKQGLVQKTPSPADARQALLSLTEEGQEAFAALNAGSQAEIAGLMSRLRPEEQQRLVDAMGVIERLLGDPAQKQPTIVLRPHRPGDMGWVVHRHGVLYFEEYGWDERFEALVAEITAHFIQNFDPRRERCWIAELDGEIVGSVFLVKQSDEVAKLRLLLVEPGARGLGIGRRLVEECVRFARQAGYRKIILWTNSVLMAARCIYEKAGFQLVEAEPHHSFGHDLVGETWELEFADSSKKQ